MARPKKKPDAASVDDLAVPQASAEIVPIAAGVMVRWTKLGEEKRAFSEQGKHKAGDIVATEHAEMLVARGFAEPV